MRNLLKNYPCMFIIGFEMIEIKYIFLDKIIIKWYNTYISRVS